MGIFDSIKNETQRNFIARADDAKGDILYRYPENNVRVLTQLTVDADEVALFFKDGKVQGTLGPGRHNLDTNNIPFLSRLLEKFTGGNLFVAEVFFVSTREFAGIKFGGPIGDLRDPETGLGVGTMVHGEFSIRVVEPEKLLVGLVGMRSAGNEEFLGWFRQQVLKVIRDCVAELLVKKRWPLLEVTSGAYTEEIEVDVVGGVKGHVASYGVEVVRLGNFQIAIKEADEASLKKLAKDVAYSKLAGGFQQYAQAQAMLGAAEGMAKGGEGGGAALQGMGLGVGMGMANQFVNAPRTAAALACAKCGSPVTGRFCSNCGQAVAAEGPACLSCGTRSTAGAKFCAACGKPV